MVEQLSGMVHEILETSKLNTTDEPAKPIDIAELMAELCAPYQMIAAAHQIIFSLDLPEQFPATLPAGRFSKAVSNVLASLSLTMKSAACLNRSIVQTSHGAGRAAVTAWDFTSWIRS